MRAFLERADADATMSFARFMELALYHPELGYYQRKKKRVGYGRGTDFFTATTSGPLFGELVAAAVKTLLGNTPLAEITFVEIGAETHGGMMTGVKHRFRDVRVMRLGEPLQLTGACVVFSNELFDAQPFHRFILRGGAWRELGVQLRGASLHEVELSWPLPESISFPPTLLPDGYIFDAPWLAAELADHLARQPWHGLFLACDYGKSWRELTEATPLGTARAYHQHRQSNDLLSQPGEQDLTCHVCWDWLAQKLSQRGFSSPRIESQEAFFIHYAGDHISRLMESEAAQFSQRKLSLMQLLHPAHLGQKFQVLHARRD